MSMSNFRINILEAIQVTCEYLLSIFCDFCKPIIVHPVYIVSSCSCPDFDSSYDKILSLDVAEVFVANFIAQSAASDGIYVS